MWHDKSSHVHARWTHMHPIRARRHFESALFIAIDWLSTHHSPRSQVSIEQQRFRLRVRLQEDSLKGASLQAVLSVKRSRMLAMEGSSSYALKRPWTLNCLRSPYCAVSAIAKGPLHAVKVAGMTVIAMLLTLRAARLFVRFAHIASSAPPPHHS